MTSARKLRATARVRTTMLVTSTKPSRPVRRPRPAGASRHKGRRHRCRSSPASEAMGWSQPGLQKRLPKAVKSRGAVSPATRARASMMPVMMPRDGRRHDHGGDRPPLARAQGHGAFAQGARNRAQELLGAAHSDGNHHDAQREAAGQGGEVLHGHDDQGVGENSDDDGRHAVQQVRGVANDERNTSCRRIPPGRRRPASRWERRSARPAAAACRCPRWHWPCRRRFRPRAWAAW